MVMIQIKPLQKAHMKSYLRATEDEEIRYLTGTKSAFTLAQIEAYYDRISVDNTRKDYAICLGDEVIGDFTLMDIDTENHSVGFRIALHDRTKFGKGYGSAAVREALRIAFEELDLHRVQLEVYNHNPRAIAVYEKVGFVKEGVLRDAICLDGVYHDEIIMSVLRTEYSS